MAYFIALVDELRSDDYVRLLGKTRIPRWVQRRDHDGLGRTLVSTIHKVKGLEFDTVVILPSEAEFPFAKEAETPDLRPCQADEARLYYVAMTRAQLHLAFALGEREWAWIRGERYHGIAHGIILQGNPEEVYISWPGFDDIRQEYIRTRVQCDDPIRLSRTLNSIALMHLNRSIGLLSRATADQIGNANLENTRLRVRTVYRYPVNEEMYEEIRVQLTDRCRAQGWFYTVLLTGLIAP